MQNLLAEIGADVSELKVSKKRTTSFVHALMCFQFEFDSETTALQLKHQLVRAALVRQKN